MGESVDRPTRSMNTGIGGGEIEPETGSGTGTTANLITGFFSPGVVRPFGITVQNQETDSCSFCENDVSHNNCF